VDWYRLRPWLGTLARLVLGVVWLWAGWAKLRSPRSFTQVVRAYDATPEWLSKAIGYGLPVLEICLGVLLIVGVVVRMTAIVSALLLVVFAIGLIQAAARDIQLSCGCFGGGGATGGKTTYTLDLLRDAGLLVLAVFLARWPMTRLSIDEYLGRHDYVAPPSAKRMRTPQGQRKYQALIETRRKQARERALYLNGSMALVVVLIAVIGIGVQAGRAKIEGTLTATNASVSNGVVYGKAAAATVDLYEDFQCPHCLEFEEQTKTYLDAAVVANKAQVRFHPLAFLDSSSNGNRYSSRAANAALCASDLSVDTFVKYHNVLFGKDSKGQQVQPAEGSDGRKDGNFILYASQAGMNPAQISTFTTCLTNETHKALVEAITEQASKDGITSTPTVKVNGTTLKKNDLASLQAAIAAADAKGPAPSPSPTKSPAPASSTSAVPTPTQTAKPSTPAPSSSPAG
jgi:protein-disulfide isomerase